MDFLFLYINLIRMFLVILTIIQIFKHDYKKIIPSAIVIASTFVPWLLGLIDFQLNTLTEFLFPAFMIMTIYLGGGYKFYDRFVWWDRCIHFLSGILFFSFGISLVEKISDTGLAGTLIFSFALSLALHEVWETLEFLCDSIFHTDHQHWQKHSSVVNHQPKKAKQPAGLVDTMVDIIAGIIGTIAACAWWWIVLAI